MEEKVLCYLEVATGIILAFALWSYAAPYFGNMSATPRA